MRKILYIFIALLLVGCSKGGSVSPNVGEGRVAINLSTRSSADDSAGVDGAKFEIPAELIPTADQFTLTIEGSYIDSVTGEIKDFSESYDSIDEYNNAGVDRVDGVTTTPPYLPAGDYTAKLIGIGDSAVESSTNAIFGAEVEFTIVARDLDAELEIVATLQNSVIRLRATPLFQSYYAGGSMLSLSTEAGSEVEVAYPLADDYVEEVLFVASDTKLYLSGEGVKQPATGDSLGSSVTFAKSYIGASKAGKMTTVVVDAASAGATSIKVMIDDTILNLTEESLDLNQ